MSRVNKPFLLRNLIVSLIFIFSGMLVSLGGYNLQSLLLWVMPMMFYTRNNKGKILLENRPIVRVLVTIIFLLSAIMLMPVDNG